jgi:hypothetical protein
MLQYNIMKHNVFPVKYRLAEQIQFLKVRKIGMICSVEPVLTEDLYVLQKEENSIACYMCKMYAWQKAKHIHNKQIHLLVREDVT